MDYKLQYYNFLMQQFTEANGFDDKKKLPELVDDFKLWLMLQNDNLKIYQQVLNELEIPYNNEYFAEIGKGPLDSLALGKTITTIISPYMYEEENNERNIILPFDVKVTTGKIILQNGRGGKIIDGFTRYITQNPYDLSKLNNWAYFNLKNIGVTVGVYGKTNDKDKDKKLKQIKNLKENLDSNFIYLENEQYHDTYVSIIATKPDKYVKTLKKTI